MNLIIRYNETGPAGPVEVKEEVLLVSYW